MKRRSLPGLILFCLALCSVPAGAAERQSDQLVTVLNVIESWRQKDVEAVLASLDDDIVWHFAAGSAAPLRGLAQVRPWLAGFAEKIGESRWRLTDFSQSGNTLFVEGIEEYTTLDGVRIVVPYAGVFQFEGRKIVGWRDYFDRGLGQRQREGDPVADYVLELADRPLVVVANERPAER
jgi:limonene-1,2-epoxide hydrolase